VESQCHATTVDGAVKSRANDWGRVLRWSIAIVLFLPFVVLLIQQLTELSDRRLPCCDYSALELGTRAFLRGEQLTGMYSREGWRHPGPITFAWSSLARILPGNGFAEHQVAAVAVHMAALAMVVWAFRKRLTSTAFMVAIAALVAFVWRFDIDHFREPWNPFTAMSWAMLAVVLAAGFATSGGWAWLTGFVVIGSFAVQTHVGTAPLVVIASLVVLREVRRRWRHDGRRYALARTTVLGLLIWLLPLIDLVRGDGNLFDVATGTDRGWASGDVWNTVIRLIGLGPSAMGRYFGPSSPYIEAGDVGVFEILMFVLAVSLSWMVWRARHRTPFAFMVTVLSWAGIAVTVALIQTTSGPFYRYLLLPVAGLSALIWIMGVVVVVESVASRAPRPLVPTLATSIATLLGVLAAVGVDSEHLVGRYGDADIDRAVNEVRENCDDLPDELVVQVSDAGDEIAWSDAMPVIVALDRCTSVTVMGITGFIAGPGFEADDDAVPNFFIEGLGWSAYAPD
jgi:hypothetical protein